MTYNVFSGTLNPTHFTSWATGTGQRVSNILPGLPYTHVGYLPGLSYGQDTKEWRFLGLMGLMH